MKNLFTTLLISLIVFSCNRSDQENPEPTDFGYLSMNISVTITEESASGRVEAVPTDDWNVTIYNADGIVAEVFDPYINAPAEVQLPTGEYYIEAHSNNFQEAAFDNPYYFGRSANFTIDKEELKTIDINAELANSKVKIKYSTNVTSTFNDYTGTVTVVSTGTTLPYVQGETREGYFVAEPLSVVVDLSYDKLDGTFITRQFTANINAQPKTLYNVNVDASLEDGKIVININVDEGFDEVNIDLGESSNGEDPNKDWIAGEEWVDERDGETYGTVQIGNQVWFSEDLRYLPEIHTSTEWVENSNNEIPGYGVIEYLGNNIIEAKSTDNYKVYGVSYNGYAINSDNVCPSDWHVPSDSEWMILISELGGESVAGGKLKSKGFTYWEEPNVGATNETGFSGLPGNSRASNGFYGSTGFAGVWWTSTQSIDGFGYSYQLNYISEGIQKNETQYTVGPSVRCIKD